MAKRKEPLEPTSQTWNRIQGAMEEVGTEFGVGKAKPAADWLRDVREYFLERKWTNAKQIEWCHLEEIAKLTPRFTYTKDGVVHVLTFNGFRPCPSDSTSSTSPSSPSLSPSTSGAGSSATQSSAPSACASSPSAPGTPSTSPERTSSGDAGGDTHAVIVDRSGDGTSPDPMREIEFKSPECHWSTRMPAYKTDVCPACVTVKLNPKE